METNESILTRKVVGLSDRKVLGKVNELRIDCDTLAVSHYVVVSGSTNAQLVLPLASALSVGDTFLTVQSREEFLGSGTAGERAVVQEGYKMLGVEVYSRTGNKLGTVQSFEFDPVFGTVERVLLDDGVSFGAESFVFFAPEFVFVDDGGKTEAEMRALSQADAGNADESSVGTTARDASGKRGLEGEASDAPANACAAVLPDVAVDDDDAELIEFLVGKTLADDVVSADGAFTVAKGTQLERKIVDEARAHDALLLLTLGVEA